MKKRTNVFSMCLAFVSAPVIFLMPAVALPDEKPGEKPDEETILKKLENLTRGEALTIEGRAYLRYWLDIQDAAVEGPGESEPHTNSFELWRFYFGIKAKLTPWLSMRFTTDVGPEKKGVETSEEQGHTHTVNGDQDYHLYVKYAWFQVNFLKDFYARAGVIENPINDFTDNFWGYRYVFKNIGDEEKLWNSADVGGYLSWKMPLKLGDVTVGVVNGAGYKNALDTNENKELWVHLMLSPLATVSKHLEKLYIGAYLQYPMITNDSLDKEILLSGFIGYSYPWVTVGYQPLAKHTRAAATGASSWGVGHGIYLWFDTPIKLGILARAALWDADVDSVSRRMKVQFLGGLSYTPVKFLSLAASTVVTWYSDDEDPATVEGEKEIKFMLSTQLEF